DADADLHHRGVGHGGEPVGHDLEVVGEHDVVGTHDHHDRRGDHAHALAVVAVRAEVGLVLLVRHPTVARHDLAHVPRGLGVRVAVVHHDQPEVGVALRQDTVHGLLEMLDIPVVRKHHINGHRGTAVLVVTGLSVQSHSIDPR